MKKNLLMLLLALVVLALATSCEKEVVYVEVFDTNSRVQNTNSGDRNNGNTTQNNSLSKDIMQPALTPPANPSWIKAGEIKSAGNITIANTSRTSARKVNLEFTFKGTGAAAVDSALFQIPGKAEIKVKVIENKFSINDILVPLNTFTDIKLAYQIVKSISGLAEASQVVLGLSKFSTDEANVNLPNSGTMPQDIFLDRISLVNNPAPDPNPDPNPNPDPDAKASTWFGEPTVSYSSNPFKIIGNAVSNELTITINNTSGSEKKVNSLEANFGAGSKAVKMLRYSLNGEDWEVLRSEEDKIIFRDLTLKSGVNTLKCFFSLKEVVGVADNTNLSFFFISLNDGEGGEVPTSGKFPNALNVGAVSTKNPTVFKNSIHSHLREPNLVLEKGDTGAAEVAWMQFMVVGPGSIKISSLKFKNPYTAFNKVSGNDFKLTKDWSISVNNAQASTFEAANVNTESFNVSPNAYISPSTAWQMFSICAGYNNSGNKFDSGIYTSGKYGVQLISSKYDLVFLNSDNQVIDLSDTKVFQDGKEIL